MIPEHTQAGLDRYINHRIRPGSFLVAVLSNDLFEAVSRADLENQAALADIVKYIYNKLPSGSHGSIERVDAWLNNEDL